MPKRNPYPGVYQLPGGGYRYMVREPQPDGTERQRWYSLNAAGERYASRREAHEARIAHLARIANPTPQWSSESVGAYLEQWFAGRQISDNSRITHRSILRTRILPHLGTIPLRDLTPAHIRAWHATLAPHYSPTSINAAHVLLSTALRAAVDWELVPRNAASRVTPPRVAVNIPDPWLPEQVRAFLLASEGHRHETLYRVLLSTGVRIGEVLSLRWRDVDLHGRQVTITRTITRSIDRGTVFSATPKTPSGRRTIPLTDTTVTLLERHHDRQLFARRMMDDRWQDHDLVFAGRHGNPLSAPPIRSQFERLLETAGLPRVRLHDLRHTAATLMLAQGTPVHVVARILGHADPAITLRMYAHYLPAFGRDAIDSLEHLFVAR